MSSTHTIHTPNWQVYNMNDSIDIATLLTFFIFLLMVGCGIVICLISIKYLTAYALFSQVVYNVVKVASRGNL